MLHNKPGNLGAPLSVFISYAHEDETLRQQLEIHLSLLRRQGLITDWHDRQILAGQEWAHDIDEHLEAASLILLLISPNFLASEYCYGIEMRRALQRHKNGEVRVIPIILRPVDWESAPFSYLQCLPRDEKAITEWTNQDAAFREIVRDIRAIIEQLPPTSLPSQLTPAAFRMTARTKTKIVPTDRNRQSIPKRRKADGSPLEPIEGWGSHRGSIRSQLGGSATGDLVFQPLEVGTQTGFNKKKRNVVLFVVVLFLLVLASSVGIFYGIQGSMQNASNATATAQADNATAQAFASASPIAYPPKNTSPVLDDPLQDNSKGNNWEIDDPSNGNCKFANGAYDINANALESCLAESTNFTNFIYEVQMKIVKGDGGGILFRSDFTSMRQGYYFIINQDGSCSVGVYTSDIQDTVLRPCSGWPIRRGLNQINVLAAIVYRNVIELYINHQLVDVVGSSTFTHGRIGVVVTGSASEQTEVIFQNAKVWKL